MPKISHLRQPYDNGLFARHRPSENEVKVIRYNMKESIEAVKSICLTAATGAPLQPNTAQDSFLAACQNQRSCPRLGQRLCAVSRGHEDGIGKPGPRDGGFHAGCLCPCERGNAEEKCQPHAGLSGSAVKRSHPSMSPPVHSDWRLFYSPNSHFYCFWGMEINSGAIMKKIFKFGSGKICPVKVELTYFV